MTDVKSESTGRSYKIWAIVFLFFCIDSLFGPPKYFSAAAYLIMVFAFSIKGFGLFESRHWGRPAFNTLNVLAFVLMVISIGRRIMA